MNYNTQIWVNQARTVDEPYVIELLQQHGYCARQGTKYDDWKHTDLFVDFGDGEVFVDVKRNSKKQSSSPNFSFTFINSKNSSFPFKEDGYFAFIDDENGQVYIVTHNFVKSQVLNLKHFSSIYQKNSFYILMPKSNVRRFAKYILSGDKSKLTWVY